MTVLPPKKLTEDSLYEIILADIASGGLQGGQRLKVSDLARQHDVSTSPVREVLRRLQGEGFVDISPNRGATVRKADADTIQNIFEILELIEPYFVTWFAQYARAEDLDEMENIQRRMKELSCEDAAIFRPLDYQFHDFISRNHYNTVAAEHWRKLRQALNVHSARLRISPQRFNQIIEEHDALLAALRANDTVGSDKIIRTHVKGSIQQMTQQMRALRL